MHLLSVNEDLNLTSFDGYWEGYIAGFCESVGRCIFQHIIASGIPIGIIVTRFYGVDYFYGEAKLVLCYNLIVRCL